MTSSLTSSLTSSSLKGSGAPSKIRDGMDDILEKRGFYRQHLPESPDSIFRCVSNCIYSTPIYSDRVQREFDKFTEASCSKDSKLEIIDSPIPHYEASILSEIYNLTIKIIHSHVEEEEDEFEEIVISHGDFTRDRKELYLCYTDPRQYDPIFSMESISTRGMVQSLVYELLYENVFKVRESMPAADIMLNGVFDPKYGKPEVYDKEFTGTALEALDQFLIPFPYKVAKALDPNHYRNIDFDVWSTANRVISPNTTANHGLTPGTFVQFIDPITTNQRNMPSTSIGIFIGLSTDRRHVEVYSPTQGTSLFVPRKQAESLQRPNESELFSVKAEMERKFNYQQPFMMNDQDRMFNNLNLNSGDPHWLCKFDFTVPPPPPPITPLFTPTAPPTPSSPFTFQTIFPIIGNCPGMTSNDQLFISTENLDDSGYTTPPTTDENNNLVKEELTGNRSHRPPNLNIPNYINNNPIPSSPVAVDNVFVFPPTPTLIYHPPPTPLSPFEIPFTPGGIPCSPALTYVPIVNSPLIPSFGGPLPPTPMQEQNLSNIFNFCSPPI